MTNSKWFKAVILAVAGVAVVGLALGAIRIFDEPEDAAPDLPEECESKGSDSEACRQAMLQRDLDADHAAALDDIDRATRLEVADALCAEGSALGEDRDARPLRDDVYARVADRAGVSVAVVAAIAPSLEALCDGDAGQVAALPVTGGNASLTFEVLGGGPVTVQYTNADGSKGKEETFAPWTLPLVFQTPVDVELKVTPRDGNDDGELGCRVRVGETVVSETNQQDGEAAVCRASADQLTTAANQQ